MTPASYKLKPFKLELGNFISLNFFYLLETKSCCRAQAGLEPRLTLNLGTSLLSLPSSSIKGVYHHNCFFSLAIYFLRQVVTERQSTHEVPLTKCDEQGGHEL